MVIKYTIIETEEIQNICPESKDLKNVISFTQGLFNQDDFKNSKWDQRIQKIPLEKLEEFKEKGQVSFTINTQTIITLIDPDYIL